MAEEVKEGQRKPFAVKFIQGQKGLGWEVRADGDNKDEAMKDADAMHQEILNKYGTEEQRNGK